MSSEIYLVTGGTGFIGSYVTNKLVEQKKEVYVLVSSDKNNWRLENKGKVNLKYVDITDFKQTKKAIQEISPSFIFHLAAYVNAERDFKAINNMIKVNLEGTLNLLMSLNDIDYKLFINTGTCEEYGDGEAPFEETQREQPVSPYSFSKVSSTYLCEMIAKIYDKPIITVRPFLTYGPKQISRMLIPWLIYSGITDKEVKLTPGEQTRDFVYVKDVADVYIEIAKHYKKVDKHRIINIGSKEPVKIKDIVKILEKLLNTNNYRIGELPYRKGENMNFYSSIKLLKDVYKWKPKYSLLKGLGETIDWWKNNEKIWKRYEYIWQ